MSILDTVVDRGYYGFADNDMGRVAVHKAIKELAELRSTVAELTAERDAAYRRGWDEAIEAAADMAVMSNETRANLSASIRDIKPTEHDADMLEAWHERA